MSITLKLGLHLVWRKGVKILHGQWLIFTNSGGERSFLNIVTIIHMY